MRRAASIVGSSLFLIVAWSGAAAAQTGTTTTIPPVREIPVTGGQTVPATTAPAATAGTGGDLASTGVAADSLVPFGIALIGVGGVCQVAARRPRRDLGLL